MRECKGNTLLFLGDRNVKKVSGIWKGLHITFYVAIAINAFISSMSAGNMFQTFKYNCILFCTDLVFERETIQSDFVNSTKSPSPELGFVDTTENALDLNITTVKPDDVEKETVIFKNDSHVYLKEDGAIVLVSAKIDVKKSRFASHSYCNYVLGVTLITFIFSAFCIIILAMCSKGGRGPTNNTLKKPQMMIYPILLSSILLGVINFIASLFLKKGIRQFCENFEMFSGEKRCNSLINNFTLHERQVNFYLPYFVLIHTFDLTIVFFGCQILVTLLRIAYAVDYQL